LLVSSMLDRSPVEWRTTKSRFNEGDFQGPGGSGKGLEGREGWVGISGAGRSVRNSFH